MSHASTNAQRLFTRAANTTKPHLKKNLTRLAKIWAARAVETDAQREARLEEEGRDHAAFVAKTLAKRAEVAARQAAAVIRAAAWAARHGIETPEQRAEREAAATRRWQERKAAREARPVKIKKKRTILKQERWAARAERMRAREAATELRRVAKRAAARLPSLPY